MSNAPSQKPFTSPVPANDTERLAALHRYQILDTPPEAAFDRITRLAARLFGMPTALISLVDESRAWFKSVIGFDASEVSRDATLCSFAVLTNEPLIVPDARQDDRFACNPFVQNEPGVRFYAGAPLLSHDGFNLGTLCLLDDQPHNPLTPEQQATLVDLAAMVVDELELRLAAHRIAQVDAALLEITQGVATVTGGAFLEALVQHFAKVLDTDYVYIGLVEGDDPKWLRTIATCAHGQIVENLEYLLQETPCWEVIEQRKICCYPRHVQTHFPHAPLLKPLSVESYAATPFFDSNGTPLGLLGVMDSEPLENVHLTESLLTIFADRIATELERQQTEIALHKSEAEYYESEEQFRAFVIASTDVVYSMSADWSEMRFLEGKGFIADTSDPSISWLEKYIHPDDYPNVLRVIQDSICTKSTFELEHRVIRVDGTLGWTHSRVIPILNAQGEIKVWFGTARNITDRKQAEIALQESEKQTRSILESITDGFFALDQDWRFTYMNPQAEHILNRTPGDLQGKVIWEVYPGTVGMEFERAYRRTASERVASSFTSFYPDHNCWYEVNAYPAADGITVYFRNVTEQVQAEAALRESEEKTRNILESIHEAFFALDENWQFTYVNPSAETLLGRTPGDLVGKNLWEEYPGLAGNGLAQIYRSAMHNRVAGSSTTFYPDHDRWYEVRTYPAPKGISVYFRNVTEQIQAETELREREERYRSLVTATSSIVWVAKGNGEILSAPEWEAFTGQTLEQYRGWVWFERVHPDDRETTTQIWTHAIEHKIPCEVEHRLLHRDGQYRHTIARAVPILDEVGNVREWIGTVTDISDRKRIEAELQASEERFRNMADNAPMMTWVTDPTGYCTYLSQSWYDFSGQTEETGLGFGWLDATHPDDRKRSEEIFLAANDRQEAFQLEYRLRHRDGRYRMCIDAAKPWFGANNEFKGYIGSVIDIDDRKQAETALQESEQRYRLLAEAIPQLVWITDTEGQNEYVSQRFCDYTGLTAEQLRGSDWLSIIHPDDLDMTRDRWLGAVNSGQFYEIEYRFRGADGNYRWFLGQGIPLKDEQGRIRQWFGTCTDIEPQKQIEQARLQFLEQEQIAREQAETTNRLKDEFLAVLSHELRSPLNPILGWTRLLQNGKLDEARRVEALKTIERNAKLQSQLIEDLLDISRIMQGKLTLTAAPTNLTFVITAAVETVRLAAEAKNIQILLDLSTTVASAFGDAGRLQQVVWNLVTNAVKFTPSDGQVTVELRQLDQFAQIRVIDTGKGIQSQFLPHVFEYFRQEDGSTTRKFGGLGLGLAIVRQIVELHGGTVKAESQGENRGAIFIVQLPVIQQAIPTTPELAQTSVKSENSLTNLQILVVDDDNDSREFQAFVLEQSGATVIAVASGVEALQALEKFIPDVLVSDVGMAEMDGYMLIQQIRSRPPEQGGTIPAIALTAYAAEVDQQRATQAGFQAHLTKPVEPEELCKTIRALYNSEGTVTLIGR